MRDPDPAAAGLDAADFLNRLGQPTCILFSGRDPSRTRAMVTLLHGNEPSGLMALQRWLALGEQPAVNLLCIVASVHAALAQPLFSHRMLPRAKDLNRCFEPPFDGEQGLLAEEILALLRAHQPEAVIDMHNTSGSGPSFGVCTHLDRQHDALASLFTRRLIVSHIRLGALMEISDARCPTVTIEVGGRLDAEAHTLAFEGLRRFAQAERVLAPDDEVEWGLELLDDPVRLELREGVTLAYGESPVAGHDITLRRDIEHHNFGSVHCDTSLGWINGDIGERFRAVDSNGQCALDAVVRGEDGELYPAQSLKLFMITTNAHIAETDCLFYAVADDGRPLCTKTT